MSPTYMNEHFIPFNTVHSYNTRSSNDGNFILPKVGSAGKKTFVFNACILWNALPSNIKNVTQFNVFKVKVKSLLLNSC